MVSSQTLKKSNVTNTRVSLTKETPSVERVPLERRSVLQRQVSIIQMTQFVGVSFIKSLTISKAKFYDKEKETCYMGYRKNGGPYGAATVYE